MLISFLKTAGVSFLLSMAFAFLLQKASRRWNFLLSGGVPSIGGISMGLAFFAFFLCAAFPASGIPREIQGILIASGVMLVSGIGDDRKELSVVQKLAVQLIAASILIGFGVRTNFAYGSDLLNIVVSLFWIVGITNAVNLLDVMDGLAAGITLVILSGFCALSFLNGDALTLLLSGVLGGTVLGFWVFNVPPAKVYMGNSGSHFLGILLASIALTARYATLARPQALFAPMFLLGFPILDTLFLVLMRALKGKSAFNKSEDHMALRFLKKGYSKSKTLRVMMGWAVFFVTTAFILCKAPGHADLFAFVLAGAGGLFLMKQMGRVRI